MFPFQKFDHKLIFVILIRYINTKLLKSYSKNQKLLEVAKFGKSCSKRQKLLKSCRAQSVRAYPPTYLPTYLPTNLPTYPPTYLPTHLPTYLPTYLPT